MEYWVTVGIDGKYYYFKRSHGKTTHISKDDYDRISKRKHRFVTITKNDEGEIMEVFHIKGKQSNQHEFFVNSPDSIQLLRSNYRTILPKIKAIQVNQEFKDPFQTQQKKILLYVPVEKKAPTTYLALTNTPVPGCPTLKDGSGYKEKLSKCEGDSCSFMVAKVDGKRFKEEADLVKKVAKAGIMPHLENHFECDDTYGYFVHEMIGKDLSTIIQEDSLNVSQKETLLHKVRDCVNLAHTNNYYLGTSLSLETLAVSKNYVKESKDYKVYVICANGIREDTTGKLFLTDFNKLYNEKSFFSTTS